jgi:hypothetical protein
MNTAYLPNGSLRVRLVPWVIWTIGIAMIAAWLLMMVALGAGQSNTLVCRRVEPGQIDCTLTRSILGFERSTTELRGLTGASVFRSSSSRGGSTYRVDITARSGDVSLTSYTSSGAQSKQSIVDRINRFVADDRAADFSLSYVDWPLILLSLLLLVGGMLLSPLYTALTTWTFDRMTGTLTVQKLRGLGSKTTEYGLDQISSVAVEHSSRTSRVVLRLMTRQIVPLTSYSDSSGLPAKLDAVQQIQEYLGLSSTPTQADDAQTAFQRGVLAYGTNFFGSKATAARLFHQATQLDPNHQQAWLFLAASVENADEKREYLERVAAIDATSAEGRRATADLQRLSESAAPSHGQPSTGPTTRLAPRPISAAGSLAASGSLPARLLGVALFQAPTYRQIADDPTATPSAGVVMLVATALAGFIGGLTADSITLNGQRVFAGPLHGVVRALIEVCAGLVSWVIGSVVGALVATSLFRGRTNTAEMLRVLGYASVFRLLWIFPCGFVLSWLLSAVGTVIAVREAAEFDTSKAVITAAVAWAVSFAASGVVWLILSFIAVALIGSP